MSDPIADLLIRIKNAALSGHKTVEAPFSKVKENLAKILLKEGFLNKVELGGTDKKRNLILTLVGKEGENIPIEVKKISKPGRRVYVKAKGIKLLSRGLGLVIISTPFGLMTNKEALKKNLGGEVICKII